MLESAARRDRVDSSFGSPAFLWEVAQKPLSVSLAFDFIDRMEREVVEGFRSLTSRGSEIGGLLLGRVRPGNPARVSVEDYETVACDYSRGPLYRLSDADLGRLERAIQQRAAGGGPEVVGFFRSHTRKGLALDTEDITFLDAHLPDPHRIALLVRPFATKASIAGIFIREDGAMRGEGSYLEFPFRSSQLTVTRQDGAPSTRAQIVPIASRREISLPPPVLVPEPLVPMEMEPEPEPEPQPVVVTPEPQPVVAAPEPQPEPPVESVAPSWPPEPAVTLAPPEEGKRRWGLIAGVGGALVVGMVLLFSIWGRGHFGTGTIPGTPDATTLNLRAERTGADLLLTWNRDAEAIRNAARVVLSVSDGGRQESYDMDLNQLRTGSIVYAPLTTDVSFRMDVTDKTQRTTTVSVRMLRTRPSPMPDEPAAQTGAAAKPPADPLHAGTAADPGPTDATDTEGPQPNGASLPLKPFDTSSLVGRLRPATAVDQPDVTNLGGGAPVSPKFSADATLPFAAVPAPAPAPPRAVTPPDKRQEQPRSVGGRIQIAELLFRREPVYPQMARQMGTKGTVELVATIGVDGHVKGVKVVSGQPVLAKAATDAVMQWIYRPTMLNGIPVPNETRITLNFMGR